MTGDKIKQLLDAALMTIRVGQYRGAETVLLLGELLADRELGDAVLRRIAAAAGLSAAGDTRDVVTRLAIWIDGITPEIRHSELAVVIERAREIERLMRRLEERESPTTEGE